MKPRTSNVSSPVTSRIELREGLPLAEVTNLLGRALHLRAVGLRVLAFYLADMDRRGLHQQAGHPTAVHYATSRLDLSERRARELMRVGHALFELPLVDRAFLDGRISWSKVVLLARVATPQQEAAWIETAERVTCSALKLEVRLAKPGAPPRRPDQRKGLPGVRFDVHARVDALTHQKLELAREKLSAERGAPIDHAALLGILAELVLETDDDGSTPGRERIDGSLYRIVIHKGDPDAAALDTREGKLPLGSEAECLLCDGECSSADGSGPKPNDNATSPALRRRVLARDRHACRHCGAKRGLMVHHIHFRSRGGRTRASNLITLCSGCHALVHAGALALEGDRADRVTFLGPDGRPSGGRPPPMAPPHATVSLVTPSSGGGAQAPDVPAQLVPAPKPVPFDEAFADVLGQKERRGRLHRAVEASRADGRAGPGVRPLPHVLFTGPAGTGKTTFAKALARAGGAAWIRALGSTVGDVAAVDALLARVPAGGVLFLDEVHAVPRTALEHVYDAMTDRRVTLLAATTELAELPEALRSRFDLIESFDFHDPDTLAAVATRHAAKEGFQLTPRGAHGVAICARGTPREAERLTNRVMDYAVTEPGRDQPEVIRAADVRRALAEHGYDEDGLGALERRYLAALRASPGPVALERLGLMLGVGARTLRTCVEPFLAHRGLVRITPRGREAG